MTLGIVILAAGKGTRMRSDTPKALHTLAGKSMLDHVIELAESLYPEKIVIVHGHEGSQLKQNIKNPNLLWAEQKQQLGTGHAVKQALPYLEGTDHILILYCDVPLLTKKTISKLINHPENNLCVITAFLKNPFGYGRIIRDKDNRITKIIEQKDLTTQQEEIREINTGIMSASLEHLTKWLNQIEDNNIVGEYYLTDIIQIAVTENENVNTIKTDNSDEIMGINTKSHLAKAERVWQLRKAQTLMNDGVTIMDPHRFDLRGKFSFGKNCKIDINVIIEGNVIFGNNVHIGANTVLKNVKLGNDVKVFENCVLEEATVGSNSSIGPFCRLRPGANILGEAHIGNFVEIKESEIGEKTKVNHLTYLGNSKIGNDVNIGAGTITCNFDGAEKHKTTIGDNAFIGSNTALVAPVDVGESATVGAGSTIGKDVPAGKLTLSRPDQVTVADWTRPSKKKQNQQGKKNKKSEK